MENHSFLLVDYVREYLDRNDNKDASLKNPKEGNDAA